MAPAYRPFALEDLPEALALWRATEGIGLSSADEPDAIAAYLSRNPGCSFVARLDGELVGAVLAGHDGRRGYLHHLAVRADQRGQGIGRELAARCLAALSREGIEKCHLFVYAGNASGRAFWRKVGWEEREDLVIMSRTTRD